MPKAGRAVIAVTVAMAVLFLAGWFDSRFIRDIQRQGAATFDSTGPSLALSVGSVVVVGTLLLLAFLVWRSRSALVGAAYVLVGGFFAFLPVILWGFAAQNGNTPPVLPGLMVDVVSQIYFWTAGPLNAVGMIGAGMFVVGLLVVGRSIRAWMAGRRAEPLSIDGQPIRP
jgi:Na+/proline symporter